LRHPLPSSIQSDFQAAQSITQTKAHIITQTILTHIGFSSNKWWASKKEYENPTQTKLQHTLMERKNNTKNISQFLKIEKPTIRKINK
jgi:hypothetical protein